MILYKQHNRCFIARAGAVVLNNNRILLNKTKTSEQDIFLLPGGRIEFGESSADAVLREIAEELTLDATIERMLWIVEDFYKDEEVICHEVFWIYKLAIKASDSLYSIDNYKPLHTDSGDVFQWIPLTDIGNLNLAPPFLKESLQNLPTQTQSKIEIRT